MQIEPPVLAIIVGMALVTYATRAGGLWLMGHLRLSARFTAALRHIPGAVLISIIAPIGLGRGPAETLATLATILVAIRTRNLLLAMITGVGLVWILRMFACQTFLLWPL
jgi:uncharacterized membrane protein